MTDEQLLRYSRHILLEEFGIEGQERISAAEVLVIGAGGLGSPAALYLGTAGVGRITLVDHDTVDLSNLQRQIAHTMDRLGQSKAASAQHAIRAINPEVRVRPVPVRADAALLESLVGEADVVLDCSDNFETRQAVNAACVQHRTPLVSGAAVRFDAQISVFDTRLSGCPCYACVFPPTEVPQETRCATLGVLAPLVGIIGAMQAAEALKLICGAGTSLAGRLQMLSGLSMTWSEIGIARNRACVVCGERDAPHRPGTTLPAQRSDSRG